jgi:type IV pilus assembly protein PilW
MVPTTMRIRPPANTQFAPCADLLSDRIAGTDILVVKRVSGAADATTYVDVMDVDDDGDTSETRSDGAGTDEVVYLRTNGTAGALIDDSTSTNLPATGESDWTYKTSVYFIRDYFATDGDGSPSLCRMSLDGTTLGDPECVAEGVEDLHLQFGVDNDDDGAVNFYSADLSVDDMSNVVTARVHLLVRSAEPVANYTNSRTYNLGDVTVAAANDGNYRRVFTTTVSLWNTVSLRQFN